MKFSLIVCAHLSLSYKVNAIDMKASVQKQDWYLALNPNGRIPALTDTFTDGKTIRLFESGSIMQYLVEQYDPKHLISYPKGSRESYEVNNWLFFLNAGVGPMQGQANHFNHYAPEKIEYGVNRYVNETRRLYGVLDKRLSESKSGYLVGNKCTIADIAHWGWIAAAGYAGIDVSEFPHLQAWEDRMLKRPAVEKGRHVPSPHKIKEMDKESIEKAAKEGREWIQRQQAEDAKRKQ